MHELEQHEATCSLIRRLDGIPMSDAERRSAAVYMRRGERVAACLLAFARLVGAAGAVMVRGAALLRNAYRSRTRARSTHRPRRRAGARTS
jgi:hypothetical protein